MCNLCANLTIKAQRLEDRVAILESRLRDITGGLTTPFFGIALTTTELKLVNFLLNTPGYATRQAILGGICDDPYQNGPLERTVDVMVSHIKAKLPVGVAIEAKWGLGYYLPPAARTKLKALRMELEDA